MSNQRENLTWLPFAFLGILNIVGMIAFLWAWVALQIVQPQTIQESKTVTAQAKHSCPFQANWGTPAVEDLRSRLTRKKLHKKTKPHQPKAKLHLLPLLPQSKDSKPPKPKSPFSMKLLSI